MRTLIKVKPSAEQLKFLSDDRSGFRFVIGAAGSGKSTAALLRLRQLCASRLSRRNRIRSVQPVRVLVLTFNRTLRGYISELVKENVVSSDALDLTVETFGRWAIDLVGRRNILDGRPWRNQVGSLLSSMGIDSKNLEYFIDEVEYVVGRFPPNRIGDYLNETRYGRGGSPKVIQRTREKLLREVILPFEKHKKEHGSLDWNDIAIAARESQSEGYDVVVVDEAQDFSANQIRAVLAHLRKDHTTTFITDGVQRIYPRRFPWKEVGITVHRPMVWKFARNHRNTSEIAKFAASLVRNAPVGADGLLPSAEACSRSGSIPRVVAGTYRAQLNYMLNEIEPVLSDKHTVAILHPKGGGWFSYARATLGARGIDYCDLTKQNEWPTGPELVALSTLHSAKGLEFDHVLLPGLDQEVTPHGNEDGDGTLDTLCRLVAMGIGRARESVMVGYKPGRESTVVRMFDTATYEPIGV